MGPYIYIYMEPRGLCTIQNQISADMYICCPFWDLSVFWTFFNGDVLFTVVSLSTLKYTWRIYNFIFFKEMFQSMQRREAHCCSLYLSTNHKRIQSTKSRDRCRLTDCLDTLEIAHHNNNTYREYQNETKMCRLGTGLSQHRDDTHTINGKYRNDSLWNHCFYRDIWTFAFCLASYQNSNVCYWRSEQPCRAAADLSMVERRVGETSGVTLLQVLCSSSTSQCAGCTVETLGQTDHKQGLQWIPREILSFPFYMYWFLKGGVNIIYSKTVTIRMPCSAKLSRGEIQTDHSGSGVPHSRGVW